MFCCCLIGKNYYIKGLIFDILEAILSQPQRLLHLISICVDLLNLYKCI
jgi:hypothetical protein